MEGRGQGEGQSRLRDCKLAYMGTVDALGVQGSVVMLL